MDREDLDQRINKAKDALWLVPEGAWRELCFQNDKPEFVGAFVIMRPGYYGHEDRIGKIVVKYYGGIENSMEVVHILGHEFLHVVGQEIKIVRYPVIKHDKKLGLLSTTKVEINGPMRMKYENKISDKEELVPGQTRQL